MQQLVSNFIDIRVTRSIFSIFIDIRVSLSNYKCAITELKETPQGMFSKIDPERILERTLSFIPSHIANI